MRSFDGKDPIFPKERDYIKTLKQDAESRNMDEILRYFEKKGS